MDLSENFKSPSAESGKPENEIASKSPEVEIVEDQKQLDQYAAYAESQIDQQTEDFLVEGEKMVESSSQGMNISPETLTATRQEQGLDSHLQEVQAEVNRLANEAKSDVKAVIQETQHDASLFAESIDSEESTLGFKREDLSGMIQGVRGKENIRYTSPEGEKFFSKYVSQQEGNRDNIAGLKKEKQILDKLTETGVTPKAGELKIYSNEKRARLIIENIPGVSLDKMDDNQSEEFLKKRAESTIRSTANALDKAHKKGVLLVDVNEGTFLLDKKDNEINTHLVDFELAVDLNDNTAENFKAAFQYYSNKDIGLRLDQEIDRQNPDILKKSEINLWARALVERIIGFDDISKPIELPLEKQKEFNAAKAKISPILEGQIMERAKKDYQYHIEMSKENQSYELPAEDYFIQRELEEELPRKIEKELIGFTLEEKIKAKGIALSRETLNFMSKALNPELKNRPADFSEYLSESKKEIQGERLIEYSNKVGDFYVSFMESLIKMGEEKNEILNELPDEINGKFKDFIKTINENSKSQHMRFSLKEGGAKDLLSKLAEHHGLNKELVDDQSKYELEEISLGIFVVFMDKDLYSKFHGENVAIATLEKNGISFISMPKEYREEKFHNNLYKENLLHESQHIAWSFLLKDERINIKEKDENRKMAYRFFQDEVIARLCSGGGMMGYSHLLLMDNESLEEFRTKNPQKEGEINEQVKDLNNLMYDEIMPLMNEASVKKKDLIFSVMEAQDFTELDNNLRNFKKAIEQRAKNNKKSKPQTETSGWDIVA